MKNPSSQPSPTPVWAQIIAICLVAVLLGFFISAYFKTPNPTIAQSDLVRHLYPLLAGFATSFISGGALLLIKVPLSSKLRLALSASAGLAIFIFVYVSPPYWYQREPVASGGVSNPTATPANTSALTTASPPPTAISQSLPGTVMPTRFPAATPTMIMTGPPVQNAAPSPTQAPPQVSIAARRGQVLVMVEDETIRQTMLKKLADYGLRATSSQELDEAESRHIRTALLQIQNGNPAIATTVPFAIVISGKVSSMPLGTAQGAFLVEANAGLDATVIASGEVFRENVSARGGGQVRDTATQSALREVAANIPEVFFRQIAARAQ